MNHYTAVLRPLVASWKGSNRLVCTDSYFSYVISAKRLLDIGLRFIGYFKTTTVGFSMYYLSKIELESTEQHISLTTEKHTVNRSFWL